MQNNTLVSKITTQLADADRRLQHPEHDSDPLAKENIVLKGPFETLNKVRRKSTRGSFHLLFQN